MKRALADLFWRMLTPSLADAWDAGYKASEDQAYYERSANRPCLPPPNPYRHG